jgi:predicted dehydrogenase
MALDRRSFLHSSLAASALTVRGVADKPNKKIVLGVLGCRIRGPQLVRTFTAFDDVEIAYLCDPDQRLIPAAMKALPEKHKRQPKAVQDMRKVFLDKSVDAVLVATPDHWHALATVWACQHGKHVYCEKPISHNVVEGRRMIEAARKYERVVQVGTQRRSSTTLAEAAKYVREGKLGKVPFARAWIAGNRKTIGKKKDAEVPDKVDYDLWLGPAPKRAFSQNRFHYEWHWFWDYGTGEIGNNGIHGLDLIRWVLDLDAPKRVVSGGGVLFFDDDRETPDTQTVTYDFDKCSVVWEHRIWAKTGVRNEGFGIELVGEKGTLFSDGKTWRIDNVPDSGVKTSNNFDRDHARNFLDCIASGKRPNADVEVGHKSTRWCHLGNVAQRLGRAVKFDAKTETIVGDDEANKLLGRAYRKGFELPAKV